MKPSKLQIASAFLKYLANKPLAKLIKIDDTLRVTSDGKLGVNTTEDVTEGNSLPVTSNSVMKEIGTIDAALEDI